MEWQRGRTRRAKCRMVLRAFWRKRIGMKAGGERRAWMIIKLQLKMFSGRGELAPMCAQTMHVRGQNLTTWSTLEGQHAGTISHQVEQSSWQRVDTLTSYINHTKHHRQECVVGDNIQDRKLGFFPERFFCGRPSRPQINFRRRAMCVSIANM